MKQFLLLTLITTSVLSTYARASQSQTDARMDRILKDDIVQGVSDGIEKKYGLECTALKDTIAWRCLNGPQCSYTLTVQCLHTGGMLTNVSAEIDGFDDGRVNQVKAIRFSEAH